MNGIWNMTRFGKARNLVFSNKDELSGSIIAMDKRKGKLLFFRKSTYRQSCMIIDLGQIDSCSIVRQYSSINAGELKKKGLPAFLKSIMLFLRFKNNGIAIRIPFYESHYNVSDDIEQLNEKANKWVLIVSKYNPLN